MKTEPETYSFSDLKKDKKTPWAGVRNYQARNFMRDEMQEGDLVLFYHSNANPSGVVGVGKVCRESYPDFTAWDKKNEYYDKKTDPQKPTWFMVDVCFEKEFERFVSLEELKKNPELSGMLVVKKGMRLSVQPVEKKHFQAVCDMGHCQVKT